MRTLFGLRGWAPCKAPIKQLCLALVERQNEALIVGNWRAVEQAAALWRPRQSEALL